MSQSVEVDTLNYIAKQVFIYGYGLILITGLFGNTINIIIFSTKLKDSVCSLYLIVSDSSNIVSILAYVLPSLVQFTYGRNGTESWLPWCKLISYIVDVSFLISTLSICLAAIDRYLCTSSKFSRRKWSSKKVAKISIISVIILSLALAIPDLLYWYIDDQYQLCVPEIIYIEYVNYFLGPVMSSVIPLIILSISGYKTYRNMKSTVHVARPTGIENPRRRVDIQVSRMVIGQILILLIQTMTYCVTNMYNAITLTWEKSDSRSALEGLFTAISFVVYGTFLCTSFYVYFAQSAAFRTNVKKMLKIER